MHGRGLRLHKGGSRNRSRYTKRGPHFKRMNSQWKQFRIYFTSLGSKWSKKVQFWKQRTHKTRKKYDPPGFRITVTSTNRAWQTIIRQRTSCLRIYFMEGIWNDATKIVQYLNSGVKNLRNGTGTASSKKRYDWHAYKFWQFMEVKSCSSLQSFFWNL